MQGRSNEFDKSLLINNLQSSKESLDCLRKIQTIESMQDRSNEDIVQYSSDSVRKIANRILFKIKIRKLLYKVCKLLFVGET